MVSEYFFADDDTVSLTQIGKAVSVECLLRAFDDESRRILIELISMGPNPALVCFLENEGEGIVKTLMCAEP